MEFERASDPETGHRPVVSAMPTRMDSLDTFINSQQAEEDVTAKAVEEAMGNLLDQIQDQSNFPVASPGQKPSVSMKYSVDARLAVELETNWVLFGGLELTSVKLTCAVTKSSKLNARMMVKLEARLQLGDMQARVTGLIPRLQSGRDVDFVLTVSALHPLDSMPLGNLLDASTSKAVGLESVRGSLDRTIQDQLFENNGRAYAGHASLTVTRKANVNGTGQSVYQLKSLGVQLLGSFDWDIIPDQLRLRHASLSIQGRHDETTSKLAWNIAVRGSVTIAKTRNLTLTGQFKVKDGSCTELSARIEVGSAQNISLETLMDTVAGKGTSSKAREKYKQPPSISLPPGSANPLVLQATFGKSQSGWAVNNAEVSLLLRGLDWKIFDAVTLNYVAFSLRAVRTPSPFSSLDGQKLVYSALLRGVLLLGNIPMAAEAIYDGQDTLFIRASVDPETIYSLQSISLDLAGRLDGSDGASLNYDLEPLATAAKVPDGCPVDTTWILHGNIGSQRELVAQVQENKLVGASLSVIYEAPAWELNGDFHLKNAGLFFQISCLPPATIATPSIRAFAFGTLSLSPTLTLFGFVAGTVETTIKQFDMGLSIEKRPDGPLGHAAVEVMAHPALTGKTLETSGIVMPPNAPAGCSADAATHSTSAMLTASFVSGVKTATGDTTTLLTAVKAVVTAKEQWQILSDVYLRDVAASVTARRQEATPSSPFAVSMLLYGRVQVTVNQLPYDLWCSALLEKGVDSSKEFRLTLTACTADSAKEPPIISQLSPGQLTSAKLLGAFSLSVPENQQPPPECPVRVDRLIDSMSATCELRVTKAKESDTWSMSEIKFLLTAEGSWMLASALNLSLSKMVLGVVISNPREEQKRTYSMAINAQMDLGTSTSLEAKLRFEKMKSETTSTYYLIGKCVATPTSQLSISRLTKELVPGQTSEIIPPSSTNMDIAPTSQLAFWMNMTQPTLVVAGSIVNKARMLYFLHKPEPSKNEFIWLVSASATNLTEVFPWLGKGVTEAFQLDALSIKFLNRQMSVLDLKMYLTLAKNSDEISQTDIGSHFNYLDTLTPTTTLRAGGWIFARIDLEGGGDMAPVLQLPSSHGPNAPSQLTLYANVQEKMDTMECFLQITNFSLVGGSLLLNGIVTYKPSQSVLQGVASLTVGGISSKNSPVVQVQVLMTKDETRFSVVAGQTTNPASEPFDRMYNTRFMIASVSGTITKPKDAQGPPKSTIRASGTLDIGPVGSTMSLNGGLIFINGKLRVVYGAVQKDKMLTTENVFQKMIQPGSQQATGSEASTWPEEYPVIEFRSASVYYAKGETEKDTGFMFEGITYTVGYCISATVHLFGKPFTVTATLPQSRSGLRITGSYDEGIKLGFVQLSGYEQSGKIYAGPSFEINTTIKPTSYSITTGLALFDIKDLYIVLTHMPSATKSRFQGTIGYNGKLLGVTNPSITVACDEGKFYIVEWPFQCNGEDLTPNFLQDALASASKVYRCTDCKALVGLALEGITTEFSFKLGLPRSGVSSDNKTYVGVLEWSYNLYIDVPKLGIGRKHIAKLDLDPLDLTIPKSSEKGTIWEALLGFLTKNGVEAGLVLLRNPTKLAELLAYMSVKKVATEVLSSLLCRGVKSKNVIEESEMRLQEKTGEPNKTMEAIKKACNAVQEAITLGAAILALAATVGGIVGGLAPALIPLFAPVGSLAALLLPALLELDKERYEGVKKMVDEYEAQRKRWEEELAKTKAMIKTAMKLSQAPNVTVVDDDGSKMELIVDWTKVPMTPPEGTPAGYFDDMKGVLWQVAYGYVEDLNDSGLKILNPTPNKTCPLLDTGHPLDKKVFVWVRATTKITDTETLLSEWSPPNILTRVPSLSAPKGLKISIPGPDYTQVTYNIVDANSARYEVALASSEDSIPAALYREDVVDGTKPTAIDIAQLPTSGVVTGPMRLFVREIATESSKLSSSRWKASDELLQVEPSQISDLVVTSDGLDALVEWNDMSSLPPDFSILVFPENSWNAIASTRVTDTTVEGSKIKARVVSPDFHPGMSLRVAIRRRVTTPGILRLYFSKVFSSLFVVFLTITDSSVYDVTNKQLLLTVSSPLALSQHQEMTLTLRSGGNSQQLKTSVREINLETRTYDLYGVNVATTVQVEQVDISTTLASGHQIRQTRPWIFPSLVGLPSVTDLCVYYNSPGMFKVSWGVVGRLRGCQLRVYNYNNTYYSVVPSEELPESQFRGRYTVSFNQKRGFNFPFDDGKHVRVTVTCSSPSLVITAKDTTINPPQKGTGWTSPNLVHTTPIAFENNLATTFNYRSPSSPLGVWWMPPSPRSTIQGYLSDTILSIETGSGNHPPSSGSSIAAVSRGPDHKEVFWITADGGMRGRWWQDSSERVASDYTFLAPGTASTIRGGSLVALSASSSTMDLFWIAPDGAVRTAHHNNTSGGWGEPQEVAGPGSAIADGKSPSKLSGCVLGEGVVDLFFAAADGTVQAWTCLDTASRTPQYEKSILGRQQEKVAGCVEVHAFSFVRGADAVVRAAWVSESGAVRMVQRMGRARTGEKDWSPEITVSPDGTAYSMSRICSDAWSPSMSKPRLYWFSHDGQLRIAEEAGGDEAKTWFVYTDTAVSNCRRDANCRFELANCSSPEGKTQLFWIGTDQTVWTMKRQSS